MLLVLTMIVFPEGLVGCRAPRAIGHLRALKHTERRTWLSDMLGITPRHKQVARPSPTPSADEFPSVTDDARDAVGVDDGAPIGTPLLDAEDIHVQFGGVRAVDGVSLALHDGEILGLVGPNG